MAKKADAGSQPSLTLPSLTTRRVLPEKRGNQVIDVTVILLDDGYASSAIVPIEVFHSTGKLWNWLHGETEQQLFHVRVATVDGQSVTSLCSLGLTPSCAISDIKHTDIIILPSASWDVHERMSRDTILLPWLRKMYSRGAYIAGICSGVAFLAESGLLDGRQATTHWGLAAVMRERYPKVVWQTENFVTEDNGLLCSGGVYAAIDLSLYLVEKLCGHEIALQCAKSLLLSMPRGRQSGYSVLPLSQPHSDDKIRQVEEYLQEHFRSDVSINLLAERIGMGPRNFIRRFKAATGRLPGVYVQMLRITAAKKFLEESNVSVQEICSNIGYEDIAFFRNLFKRYTSMTPVEYRKHFARMKFDHGELADARPAA